MAKKRKLNNPDLRNKTLFFNDTSNTSPDVFRITDFPLRFTAGKNLIKLQGNSANLKPGSILQIQITDSNNDPIYNEILNYLEDDGSRVIAVYIYPDTPEGDCIVTLGTELTELNGRVVPVQFRNKINTIWSAIIPVSPTAVNESEVIFTSEPVITLEEQIAVQLDRSFSGSLQTTTYDIGTVQYINRNDDSNILLTGGKFNSDMKDGTLTVTNPINPLPVPNFSLNTTPIYTSKIKKVLNDTTLTLESPFIFLTSQSLSQQKYTQFDNSTYSIEYNVTPTFNATQNSQSFALMQIKNLSPDTGDISRIKLYGSNNGSIGDYELLNDIDLTPTEIFVDATGSILPDVSIGFFTSQNIINEYWESKTFLNNTQTMTGPTMTWSTSSLNNAMLISSATDISKYNDVHIIKSKDSIQGVFVENCQYKIQFDAIGTQLIPGQDSKISIYLSGSSFNFDGSDILNQELPINLGKKIGEVKTTATNQRYDDVNFTFIADKDGLGSILFVIENGQWQLSEVQTLSDSEFGFTENYTRLRTLIPVEHKSDNQISFKLEYYNTAGNKSKTISYINNKTFEGGNRYIDGPFSLLTGSLFVADSLDSGIDISGLKNTGFIRSLPYAGFNQATSSGAAGFLIYSGSALPNQTETSYGGVGLELVADANNYFRFRTSGSNGQSELDIRTEKIVMSGSEVSINTPTFFLGEAATQFISGANGQLEISSSGYHIQPSGDITASKILIEGGTITDDVTILGSVSANSILTPATIGGSPATAANASSSISDQGLAIFKSASIGGFVVSSEEIRSADQELRLKAGGQITASRILLEGGTITDGVTILGSVTANSIQTPALIDGNPSTANNASSSISDQGLAIFKSASIGGWDITTASIQGGNLIMKPQGILQTRDFASGFKGWKISSEGNGTAEFENVRIRGTLRTTTFEKESVNAVGGQLWVTNATTISGSNITANDTTMSVANASGFTLGEILLAKKVDGTGFQTEYLLIESASIDGDDSNADETYGRLYVQRGYGSGSQGSFVGDLASTSQSYDEGQVLVSTGLSGSGYIKMNANPRDTATPFIDIVERTGSGLFDVGLKVRLGDLSGLANSDYVFGNPSPGFGLATDNVFLQGGIIANTGSIGGIELESSKLYIGAGTHANSNTGFYVDSGSNFSLGDKLTWDGSSLTVRGQLRLESGENVQDAINEATASNTAKSLILTVDSQVMSFVSASSNDAIPSNIIFSIAQQNLTASISSSNVTITTAQGTGVTGFNFDTGSVTSNSAGLYSGVVSGSLTFANAIDAGGLANTKANFPVTIETSGDGLTDTVSVFKLEGGSSGSDGTSGTDGVDAVTAFLTNESHTFPADVNGNISSFAGGSTSMKVFQGITDVTTNYTYTGSNTNGVTATSSSNAITVTGLTVDSGSITFTAVSASTSLSKILSLAKSKQGSQGDPGSTAKLITLTTDSQVFSFPSASSSDAIDDDILFIINQQNLDSAVVTSNITIKDSGGNTLTNPSLITNVTSGTGQVSGSITFSSTVGGDKTKLPLSIEVSRDSVSDTTRIFKLEGGATGSDGSDGTPGADGTDAITAFLTNESHTFPATADGTVPDFSTGTTDMVVFLGLTNVTSSFTFTGSNSSGVTATSSSNSLTVTGMTHDSGSINFTAISASVSLTKTMNLAKSKTGETGSTAKSLILTSDSQVFSFPSASSNTAADDDILIIINQQNLSGVIGASDLTIKDSSGTTLSDPTLVANVTNGSGQVSGSITFSSTVSGNKTKLPLTIDVAKDGLSDSTRIFKIEGGSSGSDGSDGAAGTDGAPAITGFLTNESHTFPADVNGTISSFNEGSSSMFVFVGLTNSTSSFSYSRTNSTGITSTLGGDDGNVLAISAMAHDSGTINITATSASVNVLKTMTLAKSKQGAAGAGGAAGATGPNFDFLSGSIGEINTTGGLNAGLIMTSDVLGFHGAIAEGDGTNATISDFISFLDSDGNFFIGSSSAGHFAYSQNTGRLLISGSNVDIQTPKFFLGKDDVQFISGSNGLLEISSSGYHIQPTGDITASKFLLKGGRITSDVTIEGSVSANSILVPADLSVANASASISDQGLAIFRSASIAGFNVNEEEIKSANSKLRLKASGQVTASTLQLINGTFVGQAVGSLSGSALQMNAPTFLFGGTSQFVSGSNGNIEISSSNFHLTPEGNVTMSGTITAAAGEIGGFTIGDDLDSTAGTLKLKGASGQITASDVLLDGGTIGGFELDSISIASTDNSLVMSASGQITGSNVLFSGGEIGGFTLSSDELKSSNNNLRLKDSGQITGSDVLFDGGTIGGFTITSDKIKSGTNIRLDAQNKKFIINDNTFGNTGIQLEYNSGTPRAHIGTENAERITFDGSNLIMSASTFVLGSPTQFVSGANGNIEISSSNFHLDNTGNVNMSGTITSTAGNIGGFTIDSVGIKSTNQDGLSLITPKLILSSSGQITGSDVLFDGGTIGGFTLTADTITGSNIVIDSAGSIQTADYVSDLKGWKISAQDNGFAEFENAKIRGTLSTAVFEKETVNAVGGQLYVANSTTLTSSVSHSSANYLPTDNTMSVVNVTGFSVGEILSAKKVSSTGFGTEYIYVESSSRNDTSSDDDFSGNIFVLRGYSGSLPADSGFGSASLGDSPGAAQSYSGSQVLVSTGKVGSGFIRLNANPNNQATPYIDIVERTGSAIYDVALKARLGDLSGLAGSSIVFGNQSPGFGLATDNVYLQGGITATFGQIGGFAITSTAISSSNDSLILRGDNGQITGSKVLLDGGEIAGFDINSIGIKSSNKNLILSASGQITGSNVLFSGGRIANFNIIGNTLLGKDGSTERIRLDANSGDLQIDGDDAFGITIGGAGEATTTTSLPFFAAAKADGSRTMFRVGDANQFIKFDTGGSPKLFISSSTYFLGSSNQFISGANGNIEISSSNFHLDNSGNVNMSGTVTSTAGNIGGFEINSVGIKSSNNNLILSSSGQITGSDVLFDGGTIGGFSLGSNKLQSGLFSLNAQDGAGTIILAGTNVFGADGIHMAFNANAGGGSANTKFFVGNNNGSKIQYLNDILTISSSAFVLGSPQQFVSGANGNIEISSSNFHLANNGDVSMTGTITATAGDIGGFNITSDAISSTDGNLVLSGSGRITASAGIIGGFELSANKFEGTPEIISVVSQSVTNTTVSCSFVEMNSAPTTGVLNVSIDYFSTAQETNDATGDKNSGLVDVNFWNGVAQAGNLYVYASAAGEISSPVNLFNEIDTEGNPFAAVSVAKVGNFGTPSVKFFSLDGFQVGTASFGGDLHFINEDEYGGSGQLTFVSGANQTTTFNSEKQSILLNSSEKSLSIATGSFGDTGIQLQYNNGNPKFFVGTDTGSHFKYDSNIVSISSSNFTVTPAGEVEAKQIELTDYAKADYFVFKLLKINVANSGSFFEQYTAGGKNYTKLVLDGSLGGSIAQSVRIECVPNNPIGMIQPPVKSNSQGHEVTIECATSAVGYAALVAVSGSNSYAYGFYGDGDDWFYQLFQTRVYPAGGSVTYGGGSVGDIGASSGRIMVQNSGQRFRFVRSAYDFRLLGVSSYDTTAAGSFNSQGLVNFHSGLKTTSGPIVIGKGATEKATAGYAFEVDAITDRNGTTTDDAYFHGNITVVGGFKDSSGDLGSSGQILSSTGTGTNWIANSGGGGSGDIEGVTAGNGLTGGGTSGTVTLNVGAGTGIDVAADAISVDVSDFMANGSNNRVVTATGTDGMNAEANMTFDGTNLLVSDDSNSYANIGRTRVGYATYSDYGYVSHRDMTGAGQYALLQSSTGDTFINAASSKTLHLRINNSSIASVTAAGLDLAVGFTLDGNTITGVDDSGEFTNDDAHIMTSAGVEDKILGYGYSTTTGTVTGTGASTRVALWNSTSGLTSIANLEATANGYEIPSGNGNGIRFWNGSTNYAIYMSADSITSTTVPAQQFAGAGASDYNLYFRMMSGTNRGFVFLNDQTAKFQIEGDGDIHCAGDANIGGNLYAGSAGKIGADSTDYISFTNNTRADIYINNSNEFRFESDGDFHADGDVIASSTTISDIRLKDNIITIGGALDKIKSLRGVSYTWNAGKKKGKQDIGLIAQEVEEVLPDIVTEKKLPIMKGTDADTKYKTIDYEKIIAVLVEAVKDQQTQIDELKKKIK